MNQRQFIFSKMRFHTAIALIIILIGIVLIFIGANIREKELPTTQAEAEKETTISVETAESSLSAEILFSVAASLIAAGMISFLDIWKDAKHDETNNNSYLLLASGLENVYSTRDLEKYKELIEKSKHSIDVIGYSLRGFYQSHSGSLKQKVMDNPNYKIRILLVDPSSYLSKAKEAEENNGVVRKVFSTNYHNLLSSFKNMKENVEIRLTDAILSTMIFRIDERMFFGPYMYKTDSKSTLTYEISKHGWMFDKYQNEFESLWADSYKPTFSFLYNYYTDRIKDISRTEYPPLGMLYLCSMLERNGYPVKVLYIDESTKPEDLQPAYVYAYSISSSASYPLFKNLIPRIKDKALLHIAGNTHVSAFPSETLNELGLDVVFTGESENTLMEWVDEGMITTGIIKSNRSNSIDYPFPARHLVHDEKIYMQSRVGGKKSNSISIITSRGCTHNCQFCAVQNRGFTSYRTVSDIEEEIDFIIEKYPKCDGFTILDEGFTQNEMHAIEVSKLFKSRGYDFECNSRIDTLSPKLISHLASNNCVEVRIGLESGSQSLLNSMKKGINLNKAVDVFREMSDNGLGVKVYLMHGFPGENERTTEETIAYIEKIKPYINRISLYQFVPLPGSPIYNSKVITNKPEWNEYTIYDNNTHWWGSDEDFEEMHRAYLTLREYLKEYLL